MTEAHDPLDPNGVHDRDSFLAFVAALAANRRASVAIEQIALSNPHGHASGWENVTIESYLEAALAWAQTTGLGGSQGLPTEPSWRAFAAILHCGKIYE